jgi:CDP-glycerol glycerophosphotransferase (TagB/SpsB family)
VRARLEAAGGFVDTTPSVGWQFVEADACLAEMSSVAFDWLATGKPLALIRPVDPRADTIPGGLLDRTGAVAPDRVADAVSSLLSALDSDDAQLGEVAHHYLGDTDPGAQLARFIAAVGTIVDERETVLSRRE